MEREFRRKPSIVELLALVILDPEAEVTYPTATFFQDENQWEEEWVKKGARDFCLAKLQEEKNRERLDYIPF